MKVKNLNASSRKTKALIKETFAILMNEKRELKNITVTELVKRANITRSSFYTHYDNIYDVAREFQDEALDILMKNTEGVHSIQDVDHYFDVIFEHLKENEEIYAMILASDEPLIFTERLNRIIDKKLCEALEGYHVKDLGMNVSCFTIGCMYLIIKHFRKEIPDSLDDINRYMKNLFQKMFFN